MAEELNQPNACRPIENAKIHEKPKNESKYPFGSPVKVSPFIKVIILINETFKNN